MAEFYVNKSYKPLILLDLISNGLNIRFQFMVDIFGHRKCVILLAMTQNFDVSIQALLPYVAYIVSVAVLCILEWPKTLWVILFCLCAG